MIVFDVVKHGSDRLLELLQAAKRKGATTNGSNN